MSHPVPEAHAQRLGPIVVSSAIGVGLVIAGFMSHALCDKTATSAQHPLVVPIVSVLIAGSFLFVLASQFSARKLDGVVFVTALLTGTACAALPGNHLVAGWSHWLYTLAGFSGLAVALISAFAYADET